MRIVDRFIAWAADPATMVNVVTFDGKFLFTRYHPFMLDEAADSEWDRRKTASRPRALPWWLPINAFVHRWAPDPDAREGFHDHPRWSITVCLKGQITEVTPWGRRVLKPGSVVFRSRKAIHAFEVDPLLNGETWTLFIVGRRKHRQNTYAITPR